MFKRWLWALVLCVGTALAATAKEDTMTYLVTGANRGLGEALATTEGTPRVNHDDPEAHDRG